jgi:hypothetical protein
MILEYLKIFISYFCLEIVQGGCLNDVAGARKHWKGEHP